MPRNPIVGSFAAVVAAKQATSIIPIVFAVAADPVGDGLVASLARPGRNVTGLSIQATDTSGKRLELLREVTPNLRRLAIMGNVSYPAVPKFSSPPVGTRASHLFEAISSP